MTVGLTKRRNERANRSIDVTSNGLNKKPTMNPVSWGNLNKKIVATGFKPIEGQLVATKLGIKSFEFM